MSAVLLISILTAGVVWVLSQPRASGHLRGRPAGEQPRTVVDLAVVCDLLCVALRSGASLPRACGSVGRAVGPGHGEDLLRASKALHLGASWGESWGEHAVGEALRPAWDDGADPTPLLEQLARSIRANRKSAAKAAAARLSVQLVVPVGLCLLPAFILVGVVPVLVSGSVRIFG